MTNPAKEFLDYMEETEFVQWTMGQAQLLHNLAWMAVEFAEETENHERIHNQVFPDSGCFVTNDYDKKLAFYQQIEKRIITHLERIKNETD